MPLYNKQASVEYKDSIADFSRSTLQKEQDFHVGLRSEIREAYLKFGVESTVYVSSPSPNTLKHENMADCVISNIPDNQANLESPTINEQANTLETSTEPSQPTNINLDDVAESDNSTLPATLDNVQNNATHTSVENVTKVSVKTDPSLENISKTSVKEENLIEDVVTGDPGGGEEEVSIEPVGTAISGAENEISLAICDIEKTKSNEKKEPESGTEAEPAENSLSPNLDPSAEDEATSPVNSDSTSGYQSVGDPTPVSDVMAHDEETPGNAQETQEDEVEPPQALAEQKSNLSQKQSIPIKEDETAETAPEDTTENIQTEQSEAVETTVEIIMVQPCEVGDQGEVEDQGEVGEQNEVVEVTGSSSIMGQSNSRVISEIFKNTAGIEEGLLEIVEKVDEIVIEECEETSVVVESSEVAENPEVVEITPAHEPDQETQGSNLIAVGIKVTTPSRREVSEPDWVMEDGSQTKQEETTKQEIVVEPVSQEEITEGVEVRGGEGERVETFVTQMEGPVQNAGRRKSCMVYEEKSEDSSVEVLEERSPEPAVPDEPADEVQDFGQLQARYKILTSKLEQQEVSLLQSVLEQQRIEEELSHYKKRNIGLEERYRFTVQQLDTQKDLTTKTRTEKDSALLKLRDTEKRMKELDQSVMLLKHKQIEMERNKSKICVIL